jgi:hypothetical protein
MDEKFKVLAFFYDLEDRCYIYHEGDIYPREGYKPTIKRINELMSGNNRRHGIFIEPIKTEKKPDAVEPDKVAEKKPKTKAKKKED